MYVFISFKNTFKEALQYFFNVVILFKTDFKIKLNSILKMDQKTNYLKFQKKFRILEKFLQKTFGNPGSVYKKVFELFICKLF